MKEMKWKIGDKAIVEINASFKSLVVWGIPPEPDEEKDKFFGVVAIDDIYDEFGNLLFQPGQSFNAHYSEIKKPEEYSPMHIDTKFCWCEPELDFADIETGNQLWIHRETH